MEILFSFLLCLFDLFIFSILSWSFRIKISPTFHTYKSFWIWVMSSRNCVTLSIVNLTKLRVEHFCTWDFRATTSISQFIGNVLMYQTRLPSFQVLANSTGICICANHSEPVKCNCKTKIYCSINEPFDRVCTSIDMISCFQPDFFYVVFACTNAFAFIVVIVIKRLKN